MPLFNLMFFGEYIILIWLTLFYSLRRCCPNIFGSKRSAWIVLKNIRHSFDCRGGKFYQVTIISLALFTIQFVSKQLYSDNRAFVSAVQQL